MLIDNNQIPLRRPPVYQHLPARSSTARPAPAGRLMAREMSLPWSKGKPAMLAFRLGLPVPGSENGRMPACRVITPVWIGAMAILRQALGRAANRTARGDVSPLRVGN
jgi:hypothetical protein